MPACFAPATRESFTSVRSPAGTHEVLAMPKLCNTVLCLPSNISHVRVVDNTSRWAPILVRIWKGSACINEQVASF